MKTTAERTETDRQPGRQINREKRQDLINKRNPPSLPPSPPIISPGRRADTPYPPITDTNAVFVLFFLGGGEGGGRVVVVGLLGKGGGGGGGGRWGEAKATGLKIFGNIGLITASGYLIYVPIPLHPFPSLLRCSFASLHPV